jgi:hypothetical protein
MAREERDSERGEDAYRRAYRQGLGGNKTKSAGARTGAAPSHLVSRHDRRYACDCAPRHHCGTNLPTNSATCSNVSRKLSRPSVRGGMPVGIAPQKQRANGSLAGSFAASVSSSVGVYSKATRSSHSFRLREPDSPTRSSRRPPSRQSRAATPKFNEKERAVIANLDQLSSEVSARPFLAPRAAASISLALASGALILWRAGARRPQPAAVCLARGQAPGATHGAG